MAATEWITAFDKRPSERTCRDIELICGRLRRVETLSRLPHSVISHLAHHAFYEDIDRGVTLYRQGEMGTSWYLVLTGSLEVKATQDKVQLWKNNVLNPKLWGWRDTDTSLNPVPTTQPPAPAELLNNISCTCKKGCTAACSCRKAGIKCSAICSNCKGHTCTNAICEEDDMPINEEIDVLEDDTDLDDITDEEVDQQEPSSGPSTEGTICPGSPGPSAPKRRKKSTS